MTIITSDTVLLEKYTSHFIWKGCVWEGVGDRSELQHIDPNFYCPQPFFLVLLGCSTGGLGTQPVWVLVFFTAFYLQLGWSPNPLNFLCTELHNNSTPLNLFPWLAIGIYISAVVGMACLIVIEQKKLSCSSQVALFRGISLWLYRVILTQSHIVRPSSPTLMEYATTAVFGMARLAESDVNIQQGP